MDFVQKAHRALDASDLYAQTAREEQRSGTILPWEEQRSGSVVQAQVNATLALVEAVQAIAFALLEVDCTIASGPGRA